MIEHVVLTRISTYTQTSIAEQLGFVINLKCFTITNIQMYMYAAVTQWIDFVYCMS